MTDIFSLVTIIRDGHDGWIDQLKTYGMDIYGKDDYFILYEWYEQEKHLITYQLDWSQVLKVRY